MSKSQRLKNVLGQAKEKEKKYDWLDAVEFYEKTLDRVLKQKDFLRASEIRERIGYCFYRAAFQAETKDDFKKRMQLAVEAYSLAAEQFEKAEKQVRGDYRKAFATWVKYWITPSYPEKKVLLADCRRQWKKVATAFNEARDRFGYGKACNELLESLLDSLWIVPENWNEAKEIYEEGIRFGESAISTLSEAREEHELARAYLLTSSIRFLRHLFVGKEESQKESIKKILNYAQKAVELSKKLKDAYLIARSSFPAAWSQVILASNLEHAGKHCEEMLEQSKKTKDNLLIGMACRWKLWQIDWSTAIEEDPDKLKQMFEEINAFADEAIARYSLMSLEEKIAGTYSKYAYARLATEVETDYDAKRILLEKAVEAGRKGLEHAERSGAVWAMAYSLSSLSNAQLFLSSIETNLETKKQLLKDALGVTEKSKLLLEQLMPFNYIDRGNREDLLARIKADLAEVETDMRAKKDLLGEAVSNMEERLRLFKLYKEQITLRPEETKLQSAAFGFYFGRLGRILAELYSVTNDKKVLERIADVYESAVESYGKADLESRVAEAYWQIAKAYEALGEHLKAAKSFNLASKNYKKASKEIRQLKDFYRDYVFYMEAWSEIEKARHDHARQKYGLSREHYEKAAILHESSKSWKYLAPNYSAWAQLEHAENLSQKEQTREATQAFQQAAELFSKAKRCVKEQIDKIQSTDEKDMAVELSKASDLRHEYCKGRLVLEETKILDRKGNHTSSSKKYGSAAEIFEKIANAVDSERERKELKPIIYLCRAWQKMASAEAEASPDLYLQASQLFEEAKKCSPNEKTKRLALGHSRFCKALEAGTRFADTRDVTLHATAIQYLESAANFYLKAGFKNASEYTKATQRLLDAYVYMDNANKETDPEKKAKYYMMAEKVLQTSAESYLKAKHPGNSEEVQRLLGRARDERELAASLSEVLRAPIIVSTTAAFSTPTITREKAVGLKRLEHAHIQVNLIPRVQEVKIGEDITMEIEIVNAGKGAALLIKMEEIIPEGFKLIKKTRVYSVEDHYLNMKGKKLAPLKTEKIRLVLRPASMGTFILKPRIMYLDETGRYKFHESEPVTIDVSEVLPDRIITGYGDLDRLLFGGIPKNYAVILTSPSCDEKDLLVKRFLEAGAKEGQITVYVTIGASGIGTLAEDYQSNFYLVICNLQADAIIKSLPNVFKLRGVENLTNINIALTSAFRKLDTSLDKPRRLCIEIISDLLLQHHAVSARRWLTGLIPDLRSKGFTTLAVMNPQMHPPEEVQAILGLFEGEISINEKETKKGSEKFLKIEKMLNQRYLEDELPLRKERMKS